MITRTGFGAWAIGGGGWAFGSGPQDDAASLATMRHALERGVNWIDTAAVYGLGHSEQVVGWLLGELPPGERPLVFTKCGLIWDQNNPMAPPRRVLKPESIRSRKAKCAWQASVISTSRCSNDARPFDMSIRCSRRYR
jgi:aryl-alcohol dehydrogenase-like predicted oxidoreductase